MLWTVHSVGRHITVCLPNLHHWPSRDCGAIPVSGGGLREDGGQRWYWAYREILSVCIKKIYLNGNFRAFQQLLVSEMVVGQRRRHAVFRAFRWSPSYLGRTTYIILHSHIFTLSHIHSHKFHTQNQKLLWHVCAVGCIATQMPKKEIYIKCREKSGDHGSVNHFPQSSLFSSELQKQCVQFKV